MFEQFRHVCCNRKINNEHTTNFIQIEGERSDWLTAIQQRHERFISAY